MNYYLSRKLSDPFVAYFSTQMGNVPVKSMVVHNLMEKTLAKQIYKLSVTDSDADIAFSSDLTKYIMDTPDFFDNFSKILENDYSVGLIAEDIGVCLHIYPIAL